MAFRLADLVIEGEIDNTHRKSVHGWLELEGTRHHLVLELTGNCDPDLAGRRIRFAPRKPPEKQPFDPNETEAARCERLGLTGFAWNQVGPTGTMTAAHKVRVAECGTDEFIRLLQLGNPPPTEWKRCLYLEWFSQNGRVVIELPDPVIEFIDAEGNPAEDPWDPSELPQEGEEADSGGGLSVTTISLDEDGEPDIREETFSSDEDDSENQDEYGLFPSDLQSQLDADAREKEWALRSSAEQDDDGDDLVREMEIMDEVIENGTGEPLINIFKGVVKLRSPDSLDEKEAEKQLKIMLGRMALFGVGLHICEHFTWLQAYRYVVETLCREECFHPELINTQWVQNYDTAEHCEACQAEFERDVRPPD